MRLDSISAVVATSWESRIRDRIWKVPRSVVHWFEVAPSLQGLKKYVRWRKGGDYFIYIFFFSLKEDWFSRRLKLWKWCKSACAAKLYHPALPTRSVGNPGQRGMRFERTLGNGQRSLGVAPRGGPIHHPPSIYFTPTISPYGKPSALVCNTLIYLIFFIIIIIFFPNRQHAGSLTNDSEPEKTKGYASHLFINAEWFIFIYTELPFIWKFKVIRKSYDLENSMGGETLTTYRTRTKGVWDLSTTMSAKIKKKLVNYNGVIRRTDIIVYTVPWLWQSATHDGSDSIW